MTSLASTPCCVDSQKLCRSHFSAEAIKKTRWVCVPAFEGHKTVSLDAVDVVLQENISQLAFDKLHNTHDYEDYFVVLAQTAQAEGETKEKAVKVYDAFQFIKQYVVYERFLDKDPATTTAIKIDTAAVYRLVAQDKSLELFVPVAKLLPDAQKMHKTMHMTIIYANTLGLDPSAQPRQCEYQAKLGAYWGRTASEKGQNKALPYLPAALYWSKKASLGGSHAASAWFIKYYTDRNNKSARDNYLMRAITNAEADYRAAKSEASGAKMYALAQSLADYYALMFISLGACGSCNEEYRKQGLEYTRVVLQYAAEQGDNHVIEDYKSLFVEDMSKTES
ncbi:MAG: hypothetical protein H0X51_02530 [Parachlamydiaceae bacterium]|nr:hypothetical protein [Parachlamydiaceae bacterium]